jgi:hypothetical protein
MKNPVRDDDTPIWGAERIGADAGCFRVDGTVHLGKAYYLLETGLIDADKVGKMWVSTRARIRRSLSPTAAA